MENEFLKTLQKNPVRRTNDDSLQVIDRFCQSIQDYTYGKVLCWRERGFATSFGQEWRVTVKPSADGYQQVLFRAYIPLDGYPVQLDLYAEEMKTCSNKSALQKELNVFLQQSAIQETIDYLSGGINTAALG